MTPEAALHEMIRRRARDDGGAVALLGTDGLRLTYRDLAAQVDGIAGFLATRGITAGDRVAIVLPNGLEMAVSFLAVASVAASAPLNPSFTAEELRFYLSDLEAAAVIAAPEPGGALRSAASSLGVPIHGLSRATDPDAPGFLVDGEVPDAAPSGAPSASDVALLLHTSGTTSRPKLVPLSHGNLCVSARNIRASLRLTSDDRCLNVMPLFHIHGLACALLASMEAGASVVCTGGLDPGRFPTWLRELRPTWYTAVPTMHQAILRTMGEDGGAPEDHSLRFVRSSSSALPRAVLEGLGAAFGVPVIEAYGMTEAAHQMCSNPLPPAVSKPGSVGPAAGPEVAVMDEGGALQSGGVPGEVVIRGGNVTAGYHANPEANAAAFAGEWFRTGDEGSLDEDGYLFLSGRLKEVINRGGEKVAPREVDEVLLEHPDVLQAVTFALPHETLGEDVLAAVILREGSTVGEQDLRHHAFSKLAANRVPSRIVFVDDIPKGPSGKLKRIGLAEQLAHLIRPEHEAPGTPTERVVAEVWAEVLDLEAESIGALDNFFNLGGDSLSGARARARVQRTLGVELPLEQLFREPTVATLAAGIDRLREASEGPPSEPTPVRADRERSGVLSPAQERAWFLNRLAPDSPADNRPANLRLRGHVDVAVLRRCLSEIVRRHEALRTSFREVDGGPVAVVEPSAAIALDLIDAVGAEDRPDAPDRDAGRSRDLAELVRRERRRPFDLETAPLMRATLVRLGEHDHALLITFHHIVFDAWSMEVFVRELSVLYEAFLRGDASPLPPLSMQYGDYAARQRSWLEGGEGEEDLTYWVDRLADAPATSELPSLDERPLHQTYEGATASVTLPPALCRAMDRLCRQQEVTRFMLLFAAFQTLVHRYTGQEVIVIGSPVADRALPETEELIGVFVNTLPIRCDVSGDPPFSELLRRTRSEVLEALAHQRVPFERIVEAVAPDRDLSRPPLFQLFCNYRNIPPYRKAGGALRMEEMGEDRDIARFYLSVEIADEAAGVRCDFVYNTDLFEEEIASRLAEQFRTLVEEAVADASRAVSALPLVVGEERRRILRDGVGPVIDWRSDALVHEAIGEQAGRTPDAVAVVQGDRRVTYAALNERVDELAWRLRARDVGPGSLVGVFLNRSVDVVAALLGVARAGAAFVPLDPSYPKERLAYMIRDSAPALLLTETSLAHALPAGGRPVLRVDSDPGDAAGRDTGGLDRRAEPGDLAYVIYTSGSTGRPKGVMVEHRSLMNCLRAMRKEPGISERDTMLSVTPLSFDPCLLELFLPLMCGATVKLVAREVAVNGYALAKALDDPEVTLFQATPSTLRMLRDAGWRPRGSLTVLSGGERLPPAMAERLSRDAGALWNLYGPTEATIWATADRIRPEEPRVFIGRPIPNARTYVLDDRMQPVPVGVTGELCLGGEGVARGYLNRPDLTAGSFVPNPFAEDSARRLYRTGDRVRCDLDGRIQFMGRADGQIKLRGCRIELGEIEAQLGKHEAVREAVVLLHADGEGTERLVGFVVPEDGPAATAPELQRFLRAVLPEYMVPAVYVPVDSLPLTPTGKVDRQALPAVGDSRLDVGAGFSAPRSELEKQVTRVWEDVLQIEGIGIDDDFFDLGGHSLLAVRVVARLKASFGWDVPLAALFESPTVRLLCERADFGGAGAAGRDDRTSLLLGVRTDGPAPPLFSIPFFGDLARRVGQERAFYGAEPGKLAELGAAGTFDDLVDRLVEEVRGACPEPPYLIAGFCGSVPLSFEVASRLQAHGDDVALLALFEPIRVEWYTRRSWLDWLEDGWARLRRAGGRLAGQAASRSRGQVGGGARRGHHGGAGEDDVGLHEPVGSGSWRRGWKPTTYPGRITIFWGDEGLEPRPWDVRRGWHRLARDGLDVHVVPGNHVTLLREPKVAHLAEDVKRCIRAVTSG